MMNGGEEAETRIPEGELIEGLREEPNYFAMEYNKQQADKQAEANLAAQLEPPRKTEGMISTFLTSAASDKPAVTKLAVTSRAGGVYVPPHKLRQLQEQMMKQAEQGEDQKQRIKWEMLRKSINEIINKVNVANIQNVIIELLNENVMRGIGLVARAIIKAQMASPNFTHVYAGLVSVLNTKLPDVAFLIIRRVILQFRRAYQRNNKLVCTATTKFLAHLINQKVLSDLFGLELLILLLEEPTEDSVDIACEFMKECGQMLSELTPSGVNAIFERFKGILHEGETDRKVQYSIENLFAIRKNKFKDHPGVIPELDLVDDEDQITHNVEVDAQISGEEELNMFRLDPFFDKTEEEWRQIKLSILGEDNILKLKTAAMNAGASDDEVDATNEPMILDFTEEDLLKLRETIYLIIMNSVSFEECAHKLMKLNIGRGHEDELSKMIVDCCVEERTYLKFFGLLAERFCQLDDLYKKHFFRLFIDKYSVIHRFKTRKIENLANLFAHLLLTDSLDWHVLRAVTLTEDATTASSRIFLKHLFIELANNMGIKELCGRLHDSDMREYFVGLFPTDHPENTRFAINFFGFIGLDPVTAPLKEFLQNAPVMWNPEQAAQLGLQLSDNSDSSSTSSSSSGSRSDSSSSTQSKAIKKKPKEKEEQKQRPSSSSVSRKRGRGQKNASSITNELPKPKKSTVDGDEKKIRSRTDDKRSPVKRPSRERNDNKKTEERKKADTSSKRVEIEKPIRKSPDKKATDHSEKKLEEKKIKEEPKKKTEEEVKPKKAETKKSKDEQKKSEVKKSANKADRKKSRSREKSKSREKVKLKARRGRSSLSSLSAPPKKEKPTEKPKEEMLNQQKKPEPKAKEVEVKKKHVDKPQVEKTKLKHRKRSSSSSSSSNSSSGSSLSDSASSVSVKKVEKSPELKAKVQLKPRRDRTPEKPTENRAKAPHKRERSREKERDDKKTEKPKPKEAPKKEEKLKQDKKKEQSPELKSKLKLKRKRSSSSISSKKKEAPKTKAETITKKAEPIPKQAEKAKITEQPKDQSKEQPSKIKKSSRKSSSASSSSSSLSSSSLS